jgi:hypothetical protein
MAKYDPLRRFLRRRRAGDVLLTFAEIEQILGAILPHAASDPQWWGNVSTTVRGRSQSYAWLEAGYQAQPCNPLTQVWFRRGVTSTAQTGSVSD